MVEKQIFSLLISVIRQGYNLNLKPQTLNPKPEMDWTTQPNLEKMVDTVFLILALASDHPSCLRSEGLCLYNPYALHLVILAAPH